jgi:phage terminase large subunit-like protein
LSTATATTSYASYFQKFTLEERQRRLSLLTPAEQEYLQYVWEFWARPNQLPPGGDWDIWVIWAGRGYGKTRSGGEFIRAREAQGYGRFLLVADDAKDARDIMIEGDSGILRLYPKHSRPKYIPSQAKIEWPSGAIAILYSASDPESLRGPQGDTAWCDEPGKWTYQQRAWDNLMFGMRIGTDPRTVVTGTPTPTPVMIDLLSRSGVPGSGVVLTGGSTYENLENLAPSFRRTILKYADTRLGRQELFAELLMDVEGALWSHRLIDQWRVKEAPELARVVVAVDPAISAEVGSNETGIVVVGADEDKHGYVLDDLSGIYKPAEWAKKVVYAYTHWQADYVVAEGNQGGDMVKYTIQHEKELEGVRVPVEVVHASRGKYTRAEPISALYDQGRVHHVGLHPKLEDQMTSWAPGKVSPDRLDALVHGLTNILIKAKKRQLHTS